MNNNEIWRLETGWLAGYTEDKGLQRRIKRYKPDWTVMAEYFRNDKRIAVQYRIPTAQARPAKRMFGVAEISEK